MDYKANKIFYFILFGVNVLIILTGVIFCKLTNEPMYFFFRDITTTLHVLPYVGLVSQWGNMLWAILLGICFYNFYILKAIENHVILKKFYFWSFVIVLMLTLDDIYLFHEEVAYLIFKIPQKYVYGFYIVVVFLYLLRFYKYILKTKYLFFVVALISFALSVMFDYGRDIFHLSTNFIVLEDGFKLLGILSWIIYFTETGIYEVKKMYNNMST